MKRFVLLLMLLVLSFGAVQAQESYTVNGETLILQEEVVGPLTLLWTKDNENLRFFMKKGETINELTSTKKDGEYQAEYKDTVRQMIGDAGISVDPLKLSMPSLRSFVNRYNSSIDSSYVPNDKVSSVKTRLGFFGGISNNPFVSNPENTLVPIIGAEFEVFDDNFAPRHSIFFQLRQSFKGSDFDYTSTQFSLNYRFKVVNKPNFSLYAQSKLVTLNYSKSIQNPDDVNAGDTLEEVSATAVDAPLIFGIGSDIRVTDKGYITLAYYDIVSIFFDNQGNFPIDFAVGYKFDL